MVFFYKLWSYLHVERDIGDIMFPAQFFDWQACFCLFQYPDDLFFCELFFMLTFLFSDEYH